MRYYLSMRQEMAEVVAAFEEDMYHERMLLWRLLFRYILHAFCGSSMA